MAYLSRVPSPPESDHGIALDEAGVRKLLAGFRNHPLFLLVLLALRTGMRRNELLAMRWDDLNVADKTVRVERTLECTSGNVRVKAPKTKRGVRVISIDDELLALLLSLRERHLRIAAGVPDGATIDLSLIKLPEGALMFPGTPRGSKGFSFTAFRNPSGITKSFLQQSRRLGFKGLRFHDLRGTAITLMLNRGLPPHIVAKRHGHDPATMLHSYAKHLPQDDKQAAAVIAELSKGVL
jgi:integrase